MLNVSFICVWIGREEGGATYDSLPSEVNETPAAQQKVVAAKCTFRD